VPLLLSSIPIFLPSHPILSSLCLMNILLSTSYFLSPTKPLQYLKLVHCGQSSLAIIVLLLHPFNGLFSGTTWVSWHRKGKPFCFLLEQEVTGWQWHQLDHMQIICTLPRLATMPVPPCQYLATQFLQAGWPSSRQNNCVKVL